MTNQQQHESPIELLVEITEATNPVGDTRLNLTNQQKNRLASDLDLHSLEHLECTYRLHAGTKKRFRIDAHLTARLTQLSSISLTPVIKNIDETFTAHFWPIKETNDKNSPEIELEYCEEIIEFYQGNFLNIGQIIYEQFVVALELYPRQLGEQFTWQDEGPLEDVPSNPFSVLKTLKET